MVDVELLRWKRKWCSTEDADLPTSAVQTLAACDREFFPNIHTLIRILCTFPITSAECECSFSTLRRLKTDLRSTISSERESGLALMNINYHRDINIEEGINTFAQRQPRRLSFCLRSVNAKVLYVRNGKDFSPTVFVGTNLEPPPPRNPGYAPGLCRRLLQLVFQTIPLKD